MFGRERVARLKVSIHATARVATLADLRDTGQAEVSIHATARVATSSIDQFQQAFQSFNPRHRTGGDSEGHVRNVFAMLFQSTPPHGWRHLDDYYMVQSLAVSIHATARVAT